MPQFTFTISCKGLCYFKHLFPSDFFFHIASRNYVQDAPPPYTPPSGNWYAAPPPAYAGPAEGYGGWVPPTNVFPEQPPRKFALKIL